MIFRSHRRRKLGDADPDVSLPPLILPDPPTPPNSNDPAAQAQYQQQLAVYRAISRLKNEYNARVAVAKRANKIFPAGYGDGCSSRFWTHDCQFNNTWLFPLARRGRRSSHQSLQSHPVLSRWYGSRVGVQAVSRID
jgi:hypothetical protein